MKATTVKELQLRPAIAEHDLAVKIKAAERFLAAGLRVRIVSRVRNRRGVADLLPSQSIVEKFLQRVVYTKAILPRSQGRQVVAEIW